MNRDIIDDTDDFLVLKISENVVAKKAKIDCVSSDTCIVVVLLLRTGVECLNNRKQALDELTTCYQRSNTTGLFQLQTVK